MPTESARRLSNLCSPATWDSVVAVSLPEPRQVLCPSTNGWTSRTETLSNAGIILNASRCSSTTNELRTLPELHGEIQPTISSTPIYIPDKISIVSDHVIPLIKEISPAEVKQLDDMKSKVMVPSQSFDVD